METFSTNFSHKLPKGKLALSCVPSNINRSVATRATPLTDNDGIIRHICRGANSDQSRAKPKANTILPNRGKQRSDVRGLNSPTVETTRSAIIREKLQGANAKHETHYTRTKLTVICLQQTGSVNSTNIMKIMIDWHAQSLSDTSTHLAKSYVAWMRSQAWRD